MEVNETMIKVEVKEEVEEHEEYHQGQEFYGNGKPVPVVFNIEEIDPKEPIFVKEEDELIINDVDCHPDSQFFGGNDDMVYEEPESVRDILPASISEGEFLLDIIDKVLVIFIY